MYNARLPSRSDDLLYRGFSVKNLFLILPLYYNKSGTAIEEKYKKAIYLLQIS